jgi:hypothetical protein
MPEEFQPQFNDLELINGLELNVGYHRLNCDLLENQWDYVILFGVESTLSLEMASE